MNAKNIIVISRSGSTKDNFTFAAEMKLSGVNFAVYRCDIADGDQLAHVLSRCANEMPRIRGVLHSAMVLKV